MFRLQHQFNNIVETTQLNNDQMPESHCYCECSKCSPPALSYNTSLQSSYLRNLLQPFDRSLWQVVPNTLKRFIEFGACFRLCFKFAVSRQHCTLYVIVHWVYIQRIWNLCWYLDSWPAVSSVLCTALCAVCANAPSCWKMNPVGSRRLL